MDTTLEGVNHFLVVPRGKIRSLMLGSLVQMARTIVSRWLETPPCLVAAITHTVCRGLNVERWEFRLGVIFSSGNMDGRESTTLNFIPLFYSYTSNPFVTAERTQPKPPPPPPKCAPSGSLQAP